MPDDMRGIVLRSSVKITKAWINIKRFAIITGRSLLNILYITTREHQYRMSKTFPKKSLW